MYKYLNIFFKKEAIFTDRPSYSNQKLQLKQITISRSCFLFAKVRQFGEITKENSKKIKQNHNGLIILFFV